MDLTYRQEAFLNKLRELCQRLRQPVHYSLVAKELGVNRFSAYDMLKVLEQKGLAARQYVRRRNQTGPGRSMVVFYPTNVMGIGQTASDRSLTEEWQRLRASILGRLRRVRRAEYGKVLNETLSSLSERSPLSYCALMIGVLLLNLKAGAGKAAEKRQFVALRALVETAGETTLGALAGLSLGNSIQTAENDASLWEALLAHVKKYQEYLSGLSEDGKQELVQFLQEAVIAFHSEQ